MTSYDIEPTFTTAQAQGYGWIDNVRYWEALARHVEACAAHSGVAHASAGMRARQILDANRETMTTWHQSLEVAVAMPNLARQVERWHGTDHGQRDLLQIVNPVEHLQCLLDGDQIVETYSQPNRYPDREPFSGFYYGIYPTPPNALLQPRFVLHGWKPTADPQTIDHFGMPAYDVRMERVVPFSNWRMCGHHFNPNIFDMAEAAEFVIHREQGVILEWRALVDGEVYERYWFTRIEFDVPIDPALFDRSGIPTGVPIESEPELPWGTATLGKLDQDGTG